MYKTLYIDVQGIDARTAHRLVLGTLTHYGFQCPGVRGNYTKQSRGVVRMKLQVPHCANDHEGAGLLFVNTLPPGSQVRIDHRNPFLL